MDDAERDAVIAAIPRDVVDLLLSIEEQSHQRVRFSQRSVSQDGLSLAALELTPESATVLVPNLEDVRVHDIVHELLHLERYWVQRAPKLVALNRVGDNHLITAGVENQLEHLLVIPMEGRFGVDSSEYWSANLTRNYSDHPWGDTPPFVQRARHLMAALNTNATRDQEAIALARAAMSRDGILVEADRFRSRVAQFINNKPRMTAVAVRFLGIPRSEVGLLTYNPIAGTAEVTEVPAN